MHVFAEIFARFRHLHIDVITDLWIADGPFNSTPDLPMERIPIALPTWVTFMPASEPAVPFAGYRARLTLR
jgi:hypothetical protein